MARENHMAQTTFKHEEGASRAGSSEKNIPDLGGPVFGGGGTGRDPR